MGKINTKKFREVVKTALAGTSNKDLVVQMAHIVLSGEEVLAYNDRISMMIPFKTGVTASLPAEDLNKILNGINDETLDITIDGGQAIITSASTKAELSTEVDSRAVEDYFATLNFDDMEWSGLPDKFLDHLALARLSVSSNAMDANNLHCVHIKNNLMRSSDGHRLSELILDAGMSEVLIPGNVVADILSFKDFDNYAVDRGWIHLENPEGVVVSCRTVLGEFPDFGPIFDRFELKSKVLIDSDIIPVLQNLGTLVAGDADFMKAVAINMKKGTTVITGHKEGMKIEKKIPNTFKGPEVDFNISPTFLAHILTMTNELALGETSALFETEDFRHFVQLPLR